MNRILDALLDNACWPFLGGALIGGACLAASWLLGKTRGRRT